MKKLLILMVIILSQPTWAGCESTILEGRHTNSALYMAREGALEEAVDACYPGGVTELNLSCTQLDGENVPAPSEYRCTQEVSCNVCGADLTRKYEAID